MLLFPLLLCVNPVGVGVSAGVAMGVAMGVAVGVAVGVGAVSGLELKLGICTMYLNYNTEVDIHQCFYYCHFMCD